MVVQLNDEELRSALFAEVTKKYRWRSMTIRRRSARCGRTSVWNGSVRHDPMLYAYLLDPTYSSYRLKDVALRKLSLSLTGEVAEAADVTGRLISLRKDVEEAGLTEVYEQIDLPLVPCCRAWKMPA